MPLRASLGADFGEFSAAIENVQVQLKTTADHAKNAGRDLSRLVEEFSGSRLAREAELVAQAVGRMGGASKLTEAEQRRVNATVEAAIAKYRALGEQVPPHLQRIARETAQVQSSTSNLVGVAGKVAAAFGVGFSVQAVVSFGKAILEDADALQKLSDKTGIAVEPLQRLKYAANQSGVELDQVTSAVSMLQKRIAEGDDSARGALVQLGIAFDDFTAASPDQQFAMIAREVGKIEDPMQRVKVATELFGKSGAELLPLLIANLEELGASATVMSERTVAALDRTGDKIDELLGKAKVGASEVAVTVFDVFGNFGTYVANALEYGPSMAVALTSAEAVGRDLAEAALRGMKDGYGVLLSSDGGLPAFDMFSKENTAKMKTAAAERERITKRAAEVAKKAAEDATRAWLEAWEAMANPGRERLLRFQDGFKLIDGMLVQTIADTGRAGTQFEFLQMRLDGVHDSTQGIVGLMPALRGNMTTAWKDTADEAAKRAAQMHTALTDTAQAMVMVGEAAEMMGQRTVAAFANIGGAVVQGYAAGGGWGAGIALVFSAYTTMMQLAAQTRAEEEARDAAKLAEVQAAIARYNLGLKDVSPAFAEVNLTAQVEALSRLAMSAALKQATFLARAWDDILALEKQYLEVGLEIPGQLKHWVKALESVEVVQERIGYLQQQLAERSVMDWKKAEEIVQKYGGTLENLGAEFVAARQAASWKEVWDDWQTLIDMGADVGGTLSTMQDEIQALVQTSLRIGTEIPENFKPLIEELIRSGKLFDANGKAITDIAQLKFGDPLVSEVDKIIAAIDRLIAALSTGLTSALVNVSNLQLRPPVIITDGGGPGGEGETHSYARGTQGRYIDFGPQSLVWLHGRERIMTEAEGRSGGGGGGVAVLNLDGRRLAEVLVPHLPGVVRDYRVG